ncbi:hypothetical protein SAMN05660337_2615 [Maridesulfovibrio ferrireducens]|uniref:Uncharacterized protein n=1 Tax=Maridesulfovibrio ferrireducens TaxID=246191 RepID=A0A1G9J271_9BACT|nr:hypothetical protein [Maridesulfovibrio ferrireducens]SDL31618.1 hypothetical protein SAMN05660337_2615 [Maridesulfovibrio ferrireducens]
MIKDFALRHNNYLRVAPLPHFVLGLCIGMIVTLGWLAAEFYRDGHSLGFVTSVAIALSWTTGAFFSVADIISRHREYLRIRKMLADKGYSEKIFKAVAASRCQRDAAIWAAKQTGYGCMAKKVYHSLGYRWYHLMPDVLVKNPFRVFTPSFLKTAFRPGKNIKGE